MLTTSLGRSGPRISRIGVGTWQAGGRGPYGAGPRADDASAIAAIRTAVEGGVTWIDTAASYGLGHSERVVATALAPWRIGEEVLVFTKCGHPWSGDQPVTSLRPESVRRECEASLRRLGVERLDLLQFHHEDRDTPIEESWGALGDLVDEGKVRWAGVSNFSVDSLERCRRIRHIDSVQLELNLLNTAVLADIVPWCVTNGTGVLAYAPLGSGLLARGNAEGTPVQAATVQRLHDLAARTGQSPAAVAVAWVLGQYGVSGAICGARNARQAADWLAAQTLDLGDHVAVGTSPDRPTTGEN